MFEFLIGLLTFILVSGVVFGLIAVVDIVKSNRPVGERICNACGHERGWHISYHPTEFPFTLGCQHGNCGCPAGRRSIK